MPDGTDAFTRAGTFSRSAEGQIVTVDGFVVSPGINIPPDATSITVNESGQMQVKVAGQIAPQNAGQLELNVFPNDSGLEGIGNNLFLETPASGTAVTGIAGASGFGSLLQGFLETSNVNAVAEITSLITAQRAYELNSKVITTSDEMMAAVNQMR
jgi:flagellar basal-body rod protein FlgG